MRIYTCKWPILSRDRIRHTDTKSDSDGGDAILNTILDLILLRINFERLTA